MGAKFICVAAEVSVTGAVVIPLPPGAWRWALGGGARPFGAETELGIQPDVTLAGGGPSTTVLEPFS